MGVLKSSEGIYGGDEEVATGEVRAADSNVVPYDILDGIPYEERYAPGTGFMATYNHRSYASALTNETAQIPAPTSKRGSSRFSYQFISSMEEYERNISANFAMSLSYQAIGASASVECASNYRFGLTSTTLLIHYEELESRYQQLNTDNCKLTTAAQKILNEHPEKFRKEYGDYFVAGYQYGGVYNAYISITTETEEQLDTLKAALSGSFKSGNNSISAEAQAEMKRAMKNCNAQISVEIRTIGAGNSLPDSQIIPNDSNYSAIDAVVNQLASFRNKLASSFDPKSYSPVKVMLKRYYTLDAVRSKIDRAIPITVEHRKKIEAFNRELISVRGYYNMFNGLPSNQVEDKKLADYRSRLEDVIGTVTHDEGFYENSSLLNQTMNKAQALNTELKPIGERYVFYRMLVDAQNKENWGGRLPYGTGKSGYTSFNKSKLVTEDINAGSWNEEHKTVKLGQGYQSWWPEYTATQKNGSRDAIFIYFETWRDGNWRNGKYSDTDITAKVNNPPAIGKNYTTFTFKRGDNFTGNWHIKRQTMRFNTTLYPFKL